MRGHLTRLGALLLLLFAVGLPAANAQAPGFTQCTIDQPHGGIVIKANSQTAQGYGGGNLPTNVLTVAVPKGQTPKVVIGCDAYKYLLTIPGVGTENADPVKNVGLSVPVTTGTNTVTLQFTPKDPKSKTEQPFTHTLTFQAWVYTIEPWGQIDRPFQGSFESEWMTPELTDAAGNLYVRLGARRKVGAKYEFTAGLARVAPGGKLTLYQISPTGAMSTDG
ncbi:MAG TPA: hypothetical protein VEU07_01055, partial [Candidatus Acidoferrum sp.]|nr:hypothetical protein [Candidatus Acidoferrum sp.]